MVGVVFPSCTMLTINLSSPLDFSLCSELRAVTVSEMSMVKSSEYLTTTQSDIFKTLEDLANKQTWERSNHRLYNRELNGIDVLSCEDIFKNGLPGLKVKFTGEN